MKVIGKGAGASTPQQPPEELLDKERWREMLNDWNNHTNLIVDEFTKEQQMIVETRPPTVNQYNRYNEINDIRHQRQRQRESEMRNRPENIEVRQRNQRQMRQRDLAERAYTRNELIAIQMAQEYEMGSNMSKYAYLTRDQIDAAIARGRRLIAEGMRPLPVEEESKEINPDDVSIATRYSVSSSEASPEPEEEDIRSVSSASDLSESTEGKGLLAPRSRHPQRSKLTGGIIYRPINIYKQKRA